MVFFFFNIFNIQNVENHSLKLTHSPVIKFLGYI